MRLGEKLQHLRFVEGSQRGIGRPMTKAEVVRAMKAALGEGLSHAYLCQLEGGTRVHMTARTRELLARFFNVLPGYLVDDPAGFQEGLRTEVATNGADRLRGRLAAQADALVDEPYLGHALMKLSRSREPRSFVTLLDRMLDLPPDGLRRVAEAVNRETGEERSVGR